MPMVSMMVYSVPSMSTLTSWWPVVFEGAPWPTSQTSSPLMRLATVDLPLPVRPMSSTQREGRASFSAAEYSGGGAVLSVCAPEAMLAGVSVRQCKR